MATPLANPVIRLDFKTANFLKGITSAKSATRTFFRDIKKTTQRGMKSSNAALGGGLTIAKGALIGFASFAIVNVFAKIFNTVKRVFTEIPRFILSAGIEMEGGLTEVRKAVDLTGGGISELRTRFIELSRAGPLTTKALLEAAAAGARMGIALDESGNVAEDATERLFEFAKVISIADVAIEDLSAVELARGLGRLSKLFKLSTSQTANLASSLNSAAQSSSALASEILNAVRRAGSAAKQFGFTAAETIAVQTTMLELGRTVEITGSSFEKMIATIAKPEKFAKFAKFVGLTKDEFAKLFDEDPVGAFREIFKALGAIKGPREAEAALTELFGSSIRVLGSIRALSSGVTLLDKNLKVAKEAFKDGDSIFKEFAIAAATVASKLIRLKNSISAAAKILFGPLKSSLSIGITSLREFADVLFETAKDPAIISFFSELIEDVSFLTAEVGKFAVKFIRLFIGQFKKGEDVGFFKTLAGTVKLLTANLKAKQITAFVTALKVGLATALGFFQSMSNMLGLFFKLSEATTDWIKKTVDVEDSLSNWLKVILDVKKGLDNIFKIDLTNIKNLKEVFGALFDFIAARFRVAILGVLATAGDKARLKVFATRFREVLKKFATEREKKAAAGKGVARKKEAKKEAKEDEIEVGKIPKKIARKRKPGIFLESEFLKGEFKKREKARQKLIEATQKATRGRIEKRRGLLGRIGKIEEITPTKEEFRERGARGAFGKREAKVFTETRRDEEAIRRFVEQMGNQSEERTKLNEEMTETIEDGIKEIKSMSDFAKKSAELQKQLGNLGGSFRGTKNVSNRPK